MVGKREVGEAIEMTDTRRWFLWFQPTARTTNNTACSLRLGLPCVSVPGESK